MASQTGMAIVSVKAGNLREKRCHPAAVPGAPEAPAVSEIFSDNCQVSWQPPTEDGGSPVSGYHLERRTTASTRWVRINKEQIPELTLKVTDLIEDNQYEFRVAAENKAGIGEFSPPSQPVLAKDPWQKPGKPGRPEASGVTGSHLQLEWTAPESDGGAEITNYVIEHRVQGKTKWEKYTVDEAIPQTNHDVKGLEEDTYYEFRVAAENRAGLGPFSDPSQPVKTLIG